MVTFIALFRGETVADANLIGVCAEPGLVSQVESALIENGLHFPQVKPECAQDSPELYPHAHALSDEENGGNSV